METNTERITFKVVSIGSFMQVMEDQVTILNRPAIFLPESKKKWGNEYILFHDKFRDDIIGMTFYGKFFQDKKKKQQFIRLFDAIETPVIPDYHIVCVKHKGLQFDRWSDFIKDDPKSYSAIFSTAFHWMEDKGEYDCETIMLVKDGDGYVMGDKEFHFNPDNCLFEEVPVEVK